MSINNIGTVNIETERLLLHRFTLEDACDMFNNWANDLEVCKYLSFEPHGNIEITKKVLEKWISEYNEINRYNWAIEYKKIGQPIGSITAIAFWEKNYSCEIGYCIGKNYWSKGIMTEAMRALIKFFFEEVGLNRIQAQHDVLTIGSGRVMEKSGMKLEGTLRQRRMRRDGSFGDGNLWAIIKSDYINSEINF